MAESTRCRSGCSGGSRCAPTTAPSRSCLGDALFAEAALERMKESWPEPVRVTTAS